MRPRSRTFPFSRLALIDLGVVGGVLVGVTSFQEISAGIQLMQTNVGKGLGGVLFGFYLLLFCALIFLLTIEHREGVLFWLQRKFPVLGAPRGRGFVDLFVGTLVLASISEFSIAASVYLMLIGLINIWADWANPDYVAAERVRRFLILHGQAQPQTSREGGDLVV